MMKMVDGVEVEMTPEEESAMRAEWAANDAQREATKYIEQRRMAYPPVADYLDGLVKGDAAQMQAYIDKCRAVKEK